MWWKRQRNTGQQDTTTTSSRLPESPKLPSPGNRPMNEATTRKPRLSSPESPASGNRLEKPDVAPGELIFLELEDAAERWWRAVEWMVDFLYADGGGTFSLDACRELAPEFVTTVFTAVGIVDFTMTPERIAEIYEDMHS